MSVLKYPGLQKYDSEIKSFIGNHYEPKLRFDPTPVYSVTLAEDTEATLANPYTINNMGDGIRAVYVLMTVPAGSGASSGFINGICSSNDSISFYNPALFQNTARAIYCAFGIANGVAYAEGATGGSFSILASPTRRILATPIFLGGTTTIESITITINSTGGYGTNLLAGTTITIYAAKGGA